MQSITKQIMFIKIFKLETSNKNLIIHNESVYVYTECHNNQPLFTHISLHYRTEDVVCHNILKTTLQ